MLNMLRVIAALLVFLNHVSQWWFYPKGIVVGEVGHDAVVLFFVLSGYLIAYSIKGHRRRTVRDYALARLSRLYSVVASALVLTAVLLMIGMRMHNPLYEWFSRGSDWLRLLIAGCFIQELWFWSASPPTNAPLWSLSFEFWYYVLFGIWVYGRHHRAGRWLLAVMLVVAGPKILLLLPVWIMGAAAFYLGPRLRLSPGPAAVGLLITGCLLILLFAKGWRGPFEIFKKPYFGAGWFLSDWCSGMLFAAGIYFFDQAFVNRNFPPHLARFAKWGADMSFSVYLYHFPLLIFAAALVPYNHDSAIQALSVAAGVLAVTLLLSRVTEARRPVLHRWMERMWARLSGTARTPTCL
jgi:peptidoglycan/LPS O-acetylase OafA/YrhL